MIRLTTLLKEIDYPKKKWIPLDMKDLKLSAEDILDIIVKSYAPVGGHPEFRKPSDVTSSDLTIWFGQDADKEPDLDAIIAGKKTSFGNKLTVLGSDGGPDAKREVVKRFIELMKKNGNYVEASDRIGDILASSGVKIEKDPEVIKKVINKPDIEMGDDGWYTRSIGGTKHKKRLFGLPRA